MYVGKYERENYDSAWREGGNYRDALSPLRLEDEDAAEAEKLKCSGENAGGNPIALRPRHAVILSR
jgi:hypothetical protein